MLCDKCHEKEAVINCTKIMGNKKEEIHLCKECAALETGFGQFAALTDSPFLTNLLASVLGVRKTTDDEESLKKTNVICPSCEMTYNEFLKYGTFGCPECYKTFQFLLEGYLKKIQGSCEHTGKTPMYNKETVRIPTWDVSETEDEKKAVSSTIDITVDMRSSQEELRAALKRAIAREDYEEAARIRDILRSSQGGAESHG